MYHVASYHSILIPHLCLRDLVDLYTAPHTSHKPLGGGPPNPAASLTGPCGRMSWNDTSTSLTPERTSTAPQRCSRFLLVHLTSPSLLPLSPHSLPFPLPSSPSSHSQTPSSSNNTSTTQQYLTSPDLSPGANNISASDRVRGTRVQSKCKPTNCANVAPKAGFMAP